MTYLGELRNVISALERAVRLRRAELEELDILDPNRSWLNREVATLEERLKEANTHFVQEACAETGAAWLEGKLSPDKERSVERFFRTPETH